MAKIIVLSQRHAMVMTSNANRVRWNESCKMGVYSRLVDFLGVERLLVVMCWKFAWVYECERVNGCIGTLGLWVHIGEFCECCIYKLQVFINVVVIHIIDVGYLLVLSMDVCMELAKPY